jgi:hypothetical protein
VDLAWVTSLPAAALLAAQATYAFGPIASFNLICLTSVALAGWAAFLLCRHVTGSYWPSVPGGYLFGFSPYMLRHLRAHLFLLLSFPMAALVALIYFERRISGPRP